MKISKAIKALIALLAVMVVLTSVSLAQTLPTLNFDGGSLTNVPPATITWQQSYGGAGDDRVFYALPIGNGVLAVGSTKSFGPTIEGWALMLDGDDNVVWNRTYLEGGGTELRYAVNLTDGYLLVGNQLLQNTSNGYVAKVDFEGNIVWKTVLVGENLGKLFSGVASSDGYTVFGLTFPDGDNGKSAGWIAKLDLNGKLVWSKTYAQDADTTLRAAVATPDGGYAAAGYCDPTGHGNYDFLLLKINRDGIELWNRTIGGQDTQKAYSMTNAPDGYVLAGESQSPQTDADAYVVKVDFEGNLLWNKTVGGSQADSASYIGPAKGGGYIVCGFTFSFGAGNRDFWLFKISDSGQVQFSCTAGDAGYQEAYAAIDEGNNQYVMVGWTDPIGHPELIGKATYDWWIVKLSPSGGGGILADPLVVVTSTATFAVLVATLLLLLRMHKTRR